MRVSEYIYKGWYFFSLKFVYSMPPPAPAFHSPPGILLNSSEITTPVSADTVEYAKKLIDELTTSSFGKPSKALAVYPQVPNYAADLMPRKLSSQDLMVETAVMREKQRSVTQIVDQLLLRKENLHAQTLKVLVHMKRRK